jgi:ACT domain-containing protein
MKSKDKLRKALQELFSENSKIKIENLRISDLWEKAGVSKATLYRYKDIVEEFYQKLEDHTNSQSLAGGL